MMQALTFDWFKGIWSALGCTRDNEVAWQVLRQCYKQAHRQYHTWEHPTRCIDILNGVSQHAGRPAEVAFALLIHDAVYTIDRQAGRDNENVRASGRLSNSLLQDGGAPEDTVRRCYDSVLATAHLNMTLIGDPALTADIDMSILGTTWDEYETYMQATEAEYRYSGELSELEWCLGRWAFLKRSQGKILFHTNLFRERCQDQAESNMAEEIRRLRSRIETLEV